MEASDVTTIDVVHPEVRAHINSLVSALGGVSADDDGQYQLGDDALEVLRDLKRWIRFYDEKTNRMDVARCIFEANLIEGDLLPILKTWPENATDSKFRARIALACFEVMVPLTWPLERDKDRMTVNHHRHMPVLEHAQLAYKKAIINFDGARILHTAVRAALPSMALAIGDRTQRDLGIIKLVLFFLRNMASIDPPPDVKYEGDESQISRSATVDAFSYQDIFMVLLTLASNMGEDFRNEDTTVMEIIYHLVKRVDISQIWMNEGEQSKAKANELGALMQKEKAMLKASAPQTRHSRFGTTIWVKRDDGKMSTLTGQDALVSATARARKLDSTKTFKPPRRGRKADKVDREMGPTPKLNARANGQLCGFVEEFLDAGFNPLFSHVRKSIEREAPHAMAYHRRQFFYLIAWFLEAERMRRKSNKSPKNKSTEEVTSFNLVAGVLNQEMFITLNRALHGAYENKDWHELTAVMRCFTQILLTVSEMTECGNEDDEDIAENILSRLFYEEATHDAIANIIRSYKDQGFDYLDAATELVHHFLRILETYSKQNADMQVKSRKRTQKKKKKAAQATTKGDDPKIHEEEVEMEDGSEDDMEAAEKAAKERKFDFHRFSLRFTPQGVVDTFVTFTEFYSDLTDTQLKRCHRYFYRLAFKQEQSVMLFRVDIIHLLHNMIKGPEPLDKSSSLFKEWEELVKQILRKCFKKIEERPELIVELLFSKTQSTTFFLQHGYEKEASSAKGQAKPAAELEFKYTEERDRQVAIVIGVLLDKNQTDHIAWIKGVLTKAESERRSWVAAAEEADALVDGFMDDDDLREPASKSLPVIDVRPDDDERRTAIFKNPHLRLLMTVAGFERPSLIEESQYSIWTIPPDISPDHLKDTLHFINQAEFNPPTFEDGVLAENQLKRKTAPRKKAAYDDDEDDNGDGWLDDEMLFPAGGPTTRKAIDAPKKPKSKRSRRPRDPDEEPDQELLDERARKRRDKESEKLRKIKSALYVNEGDDEWDSEEDEKFFARERALQKLAQKAAEESVAANSGREAPKKRKSRALLVDSDEEMNDGDDLLGFSDKESGSDNYDDDTIDNRGMEDTPVDSDREARKRRKTTVDDQDEDEDVHMASPGKDDDAAGEEETDAPGGDAGNVPAPSSRRQRVRGGFVLDSDDEE